MFSISAIQRQRFQKGILIFLFSLLSVALIITWNTPATGYESSIYWSTPLILWASVIASGIVGVALIVVSIAKNELEQNFLRKVGFLLVFLCYTICLALFVIRGYHMWGITGDPATHIGWTKETLVAGHAPTSIIYPFIHIYLSEFVYLTDLDLVFLHKGIPLIFGLLCVLFMYVFAKAVFSEPARALLVGVISCCLPLGWYLNLTPNGLANLFIPFALFLVIKHLQQRKWSWAIVLTAVILIYPTFHPIPTIFLGLTYLTLWMATKLPDVTRVLHKQKSDVICFSRPDFRLVLPFLLLIIWFIFWFSSFPPWGWTIRSMYQTIAIEDAPSHITALADQITYAQGYGYSVIEQVIKRLWNLTILSVLSVFSLPLLWRDFLHGRHDGYLFLFYGPLGALALAIPMLYVLNLAGGPLRFTAYASILGMLFAAYFLSFLLTDERVRSIVRTSGLKTAIVILIILSLFLSGLLNLYPSPYNLSRNLQTTQMETSGMTYIFEHNDVTVPVSGIYIAPGRFTDLLLTPEETSTLRLPRHLDAQECAPWHFGYDKYSSISSVYSEETYLILTQLDKAVYVDCYPDMAQFRYNSQDFEQLSHDPGANFLYSNEGLDLWKITMVT
jgi:hypothetical protein